MSHTSRSRYKNCCQKHQEQEQQQPRKKVPVPMSLKYNIVLFVFLFFFLNSISSPTTIRTTSAFTCTTCKQQNHHNSIPHYQQHQRISSQQKQQQYQQRISQPREVLNQRFGHILRQKTITTADTIRSLSSSSSALNLSNNNNNLGSSSSSSSYDLTKPVFDLYSLRLVRGDALTRYNTLNQSEPLRINILFFILFVCICAPFLAEEMNGVSLVPLQLVGTSIIALGSCYFLQQQCTKRSIQITRIEKELLSYQLQIKIPTKNKFADYTYEKQPITIQQFLVGTASSSSSSSSNGRRIIAITGSDDEIKVCLQEIQVLGVKRLQQANTYVVVVPTTMNNNNNNNKFNDWLGTSNTKPPLWLLQPNLVNEWQDYFFSLVETSSATTSTGSSTSSRTRTTSETSISTSTTTFRWFGLSSTGRSFGSGTSIPSWLQIMGKSLPPVDLFDYPITSASLPSSKNPSTRYDDATTTTTTSTSSSTEQILLNLQKQFYHALTSGNRTLMNQIYFDDTKKDDDSYYDKEVNQVIEQGGRLDTWEMCLQENARPSGMQINDVDCFVVMDDHNQKGVAYTTAIEFPMVSVSYSTMSSSTATLLAVQKWIRIIPQSIITKESQSQEEEEQWKLVQHRTIPWTPDQPARGMLICDCRGCVSLVRSK